jgi:hypothetical protein
LFDSSRPLQDYKRRRHPQDPNAMPLTIHADPLIHRSRYATRLHAPMPPGAIRGSAARCAAFAARFRHYFFTSPRSTTARQQAKIYQEPYRSLLERQTNVRLR